jgi:hypothetical protein
MVTPDVAIRTLDALQIRKIGSFEEANAVRQACCMQIRIGWKQVALHVAELEAEDRQLFLRTLRGAFGRTSNSLYINRGSGPDPRKASFVPPPLPAALGGGNGAKISTDSGTWTYKSTHQFDNHGIDVDDRVAAAHWNGAPPLLRQIVLDFIGGAGALFVGSPLYCKNVGEMRLALKAIDMLDDIGAGLLGDMLARVVAKQIETHNIHTFLRLTMQSDSKGIVCGRDTILRVMLPLLSVLPDLEALIEQDQNKALQLLLHASDSQPFHGLDNFKKRLLHHAVTHVGEMDPQLYARLPFELQMKILTIKMRNEEDDLNHIIGPTGQDMTLSTSRNHGPAPSEGRWRQVA